MRANLAPLLGSMLIFQILMNSGGKSQATRTLEEEPSKNLLERQEDKSSASTNLNSNDEEETRKNADPNQIDKRTFVIELLGMLHEQYGNKAGGKLGEQITNIDRQSVSSTRQSMMSQLLNAIGADGDVRRLTDWVQNSFNLASIGELTTQFVVSKLGSVNCAAILKPDGEESLLPRFLLFNEHFVDVPFELPMKPSRSECIANGRFDPARKTVLLIHGYLAGYTLVDGFTNIKNRILDINKLVSEQALAAFTEASKSNGSYLLTEDIELKVRQQQYNVIIVDWFNGANPVPRSRYIRAAVNAQVVGRLIARFLAALVGQCGTPASNIQIIAHSLGKLPCLCVCVSL